MLLSVRWICEGLDILCAELEITSVGRTGCHSVHTSTDNVFVDQMKIFSGRVLVCFVSVGRVFMLLRWFFGGPHKLSGHKVMPNRLQVAA